MNIKDYVSSDSIQKSLTTGGIKLAFKWLFSKFKKQHKQKKKKVKMSVELNDDEDDLAAQ